MKKTWNQATINWLRQRLIDCLWKQIEKRIIKWWEEQAYCERIVTFAVGIVSILFFGGSTIYLFRLSFTNTEPARNLILLATALVGLYFINRRTKAAEKEAKTAEQGLTVERLTRAINQFADEKPSVRLGGILGLEQIVQLHEEEREKIVRILSLRIREFTSEIENRSKNLDLGATVSSLARIAKPLKKKKRFLCELSNIDLSELRFDLIDLSYFNLGGANLSRTVLSKIDFTNTYLVRANLRYAQFDAVNFSGAYLNRANFSHAQLDDTNIRSAFLNNANLSDAFLSNANLSDAFLSNANLSNADLSVANLSRARLNGADLSGADIDGANISGANFSGVDGLTQRQIDRAFCKPGQLPHNLPDRMKPPPEIDSGEDEEDGRAH